MCIIFVRDNVYVHVFMFDNSREYIILRDYKYVTLKDYKIKNNLTHQHDAQ